jgi:uncharacterized 2Fe-2S/4Fe-4S cluster protein (DUF4445 family)
MAMVVDDAQVMLPQRHDRGGDKGAARAEQQLKVDARARLLALDVQPATTERPESLLDRILAALATEYDERPAAQATALRGLSPAFAHGRVRALVVDEQLVSVDEKPALAAFGLAVDIGTTTLAGYLMDLGDGSCLGVRSMQNPQTAFGGDVLSRISAARHDEAKSRSLRKVLIDGVNTLVGSLVEEAGLERVDVCDMLACGNTTMIHFFLGLSPASLAVVPYNSVADAPVETTAWELGVTLAREGRVRTMPGCRSFVGSDTVSAVLASGMHRSSRDRVLIDIGTNGEIVVGGSEHMIATSAAAGPAFEGANIEFGLRAVPGAIDAVSFDGDLVIGTIEGDEPIGICGSGVIDAVYAFRMAGLIEANGTIVPSHPNALLNRRIIEWGRGRAIVLSDRGSLGRRILVTQEDIRQVQLAKGAIRAGIDLLMEDLCLSAAELEEIVLAGAFGSYIRPQSALGIGIIPSIPLERIHAIGNAAGRGAQMALLSRAAHAESLRISDRLRYLPLSSVPGFHRRFVAAMTFPELSVPVDDQESS